MIEPDRASSFSRCLESKSRRSHEHCAIVERTCSSPTWFTTSTKASAAAGRLLWQQWQQRDVNLIGGPQDAIFMLTPGGEWVLSLDPNSLDDRAPLMACILLFAYELRWKLQLSTVDRV